MYHSPVRIAIVSTHPIQYNAPFFRLLQLEPSLEPKVFYTWSQTEHGQKFDPGFGKKIEWDIPLLDGYVYEFVTNEAQRPGSDHFMGIVNPSLVKKIQEWKPDMILVYGWSFKSHLQCLRFFYKKIPVLFRGDSTMLDEKKGVKQLLRRVLLKWVYHHINYALYTGINNKSYFLAHGLAEAQLVFAPHAIDNDRFAEPDKTYIEKAMVWRRKLGILDDELVVLFAAKFEPKKNPFFLVRLAKLTADKKIRFLMVGNGILEEKLKKDTAHDARFIFLDFQNQQQMPVVYRLGDVFILPSTGPGESWGLAVNEAMACGKPVMVSDMAGCAADLVKPHQNGIRFNPADAATCAAYLITLFENRQQVNEAKNFSRQLIREYSFSKTVTAIKTIAGQS